MNNSRDQVLIKLTCFRVIVLSGAVGASQMGTVVARLILDTSTTT